MGATQTVSLVFTDLVGSTAHATRLGPEDADALRREHFGILREAIAHCGGEEVKNLGDGVMASFDRVAAAVNCAIGMQQRIETRNRQASPRLDVKIGVAVGDAVGEAGDWFGAPWSRRRDCARRPAADRSSSPRRFTCSPRPSTLPPCARPAHSS